MERHVYMLFQCMKFSEHTGEKLIKLVACAKENWIAVGQSRFFFFGYYNYHIHFFFFFFGFFFFLGLTPAY